MSCSVTFQTIKDYYEQISDIVIYTYTVKVFSEYNTYSSIEMEPINAQPVVDVIGGIMLAARGDLERTFVWVGRVLGSLDILEPPNVVHRKPADDIRILPRGLERTPPPRVSDNVNVWAPVRQSTTSEVVHRPSLGGNNLIIKKIY